VSFISKYITKHKGLKFKNKIKECYDPDFYITDSRYMTASIKE